MRDLRNISTVISKVIISSRNTLIHHRDLSNFRSFTIKASFIKEQRPIDARIVAAICPLIKWSQVKIDILTNIQAIL